MNPGAQEDSIPQALSRARLQFSSDSTVDVSVYIQHGGCFGWAFLSLFEMRFEWSKDGG